MSKNKAQKSVENQAVETENQENVFNLSVSGHIIGKFDVRLKDAANNAVDASMAYLNSIVAMDKIIEDAQTEKRSKSETLGDMIYAIYQVADVSNTEKDNIVKALSSTKGIDNQSDAYKSARAFSRMASKVKAVMTAHNGKRPTQQDGTVLTWAGAENALSRAKEETAKTEAANNARTVERVQAQRTLEDVTEEAAQAADSGELSEDVIFAKLAEACNTALSVNPERLKAFLTDSLAALEKADKAEAA